MTDFEYIMSCYREDLSPEEKQKFEKRIAGDGEFAGEVAFFLSTMQVVSAQDMDERKKWFREIYEKNKGSAKVIPFRKIIYGLAVAAVLTGFIIGYRLLEKPAAVDQLASQYVKDNLSALGTTMGSLQDSLQMGLDLYNKGRLSDAAQVFEGLVKRDSGNVDAQKYKGIVYLRMKDYEKAIDQFRYLGNIKGLNSNPGKFYRALALMERSHPGDSDSAKQLLQAVVDQRLEGNEMAADWLKKIK